MFRNLVVFFVLVFGTILFASIVPLFQLLYYKLRQPRFSKKCYFFSIDVYESEYPDGSFFEKELEFFDSRKKEEYNIPLP